MAAALAAGTIALAIHPTALRVDSGPSPRAFSYGRVQLWFWTAIVMGSYIAAYFYKHGAVTWNDTCLALLGISGGTTTLASIVDGRQRTLTDALTKAKPQLVAIDQTSEGFLIDILSDEHGVSVNRFQAVMFNVIYSITFIVGVSQSIKSAGAFAFPELDSTALGLLGISAGTYLGLKINETPGLTPAPATSTAATTAAAPVTSVVAASVAPAVDSEVLPDLDRADDRDD